MPFEKNPDEIGALWMKHGAKGEWMSGTIEGIGPVVVFPVNSKSPKAPTYRVLKSKPREERSEAAGMARDVFGGDVTVDDIGF